MAWVLTDNQNYEDIADAINAKLGTNNQYYPSEMASAIRSISGSGGSDIDAHTTFGQMNEVASEYLADTTYQNQTYDGSVEFSNSVMATIYRPQSEEVAASYRTDEPVAKPISIRHNGTLHIVDDSTHIKSETVTSGDYNLINTTPSVVAYYINENNGNILQCGSTTATGQVRMIYTTSEGGNNFTSANIRDIGGWTCDGGYIKYGKVIRGMRFNGSPNATISNYDLNTFRNLLGIRSEIDLRQSDEINNVSGSAFGSDVEWHHYALQDYVNSLTNNETEYRDIFKQIAYDVSHNNPIYMHCAAGCDRTGTTCAMLEGLLGVARYNIDKDYELSSLVNFKFRTGSSTGQVTDEFVRFRTRSGWINFIKYFNQYAGSTFRDKVINYLLSIGVTLTEINTIRQCLIEGNPEVISGYSITYNLVNTTSSNTDTSIMPGQSYSTTISVAPEYQTPTITVTMGGVNITSSAVSGNNISIQSVTGDIVITAMSSAITYTVQNTLTYATNSNASSSIIMNSRYLATISPNTGYQITSTDISVTMGGTDITNQVVVIHNLEATIDIPSVTGDITITVNATTAQTTYTVSLSLTHATSSNQNTVVVEGEPYSTVILPQTDYVFDDANGVTVTMDGGGQISKSYQSSNKSIEITISSITGNISISGTAEPNFYTVTYDYTEVDSADKPTRITKGNGLDITLIPNTGCAFDSVSCMEGNTSVAVTDGTGADIGKKKISIATVSDNLVITAKASHVNIITNAFFSRGTYYSALNWSQNTRLNSGGSTEVAIDFVTSDYVPIYQSNRLQLKNVTLSTNPSGTYFALYYDNNGVKTNIPCLDNSSGQLVYTGSSKQLRPDSSTLGDINTVDGFYILENFAVDIYNIKVNLGTASTSTYTWHTDDGTHDDGWGEKTFPMSEYTRISFKRTAQVDPELYLYET